MLAFKNLDIFWGGISNTVSNPFIVVICVPASKVVETKIAKIPRILAVVFMQIL